MRPRTNIEKEAAWLSRRLPNLSMGQIEDADRNLFTPQAFYTKKHGYACLECGHRFRIPGYEDLTGKHICPNCGKNLTPTATTKTTLLERQSYMLIDTLHNCGKEWVVQRLFHVEKYMRVGCKAELRFHPIAEYFTTQGHQVCLGVPITSSGYWAHGQSLSIKKPTNRYSGYYGTSYDSYRFEPHYLHFQSMPSILSRNGYRGTFEGYIPQEFIRLLLAVPDYEQLYKLGGDSLARYCEDRIFHQYKIACRHKYDISDINLWVDVIRLLRKLNMDDRNPKHICPDNLRQWHDNLLGKWNKIQAKIREQERQAEELRRLEREKSICEDYIKRVSRFMQIHIQDDLLNITPIPSVDAVREEGNAMHHCVFSMKYYEKPDVLLLSARDKMGNRIETIEVNLKTYQVIQSRGVCNRNTDHHDRILSLMSQGMNQIKQLNTNLKSA